MSRTHRHKIKTSGSLFSSYKYSLRRPKTFNEKKKTLGIIDELIDAGVNVPKYNRMRSRVHHTPTWWDDIPLSSLGESKHT